MRPFTAVIQTAWPLFYNPWLTMRLRNSLRSRRKAKLLHLNEGGCETRKKSMLIYRVKNVVCFREIICKLLFFI